MVYCKFSRGLAAFLQSVQSIEALQLPTEEPTEWTEAEYAKAHDVYKTSQPGLFHQLGMSSFHILRDYAQQEAAQAGRPPVSGVPGDCADADCASALRHRITAKHGKLQESLIEYQGCRLKELKCDDVGEESPVETIMKTLAALEPVAQALHFLHPTHAEAKEAAEQIARFTRAI